MNQRDGLSNEIVFKQRLPPLQAARRPEGGELQGRVGDWGRLAKAAPAAA